MLKSIDLSNMETIPEQNDEYYHLIPQEVFKRTAFENCRQNAIWDMNVRSDGRVFLSLCAELSEALYARLYEYMPDGSFRLCFNLEDVILQKDNAIRASKIHSSISFMNDGRLIMTTHTTAKAPQHPFWMVDAYYNHQFEGFQGSNIIIYDPDTNTVENRGVPVPFETIYGGTYDSKHNSFYFAGMLKGHLYRYDIDTNKLTDYGQTTEFGSFRFIMGKDGNMYTTTRCGRFYRLNTETDEIEYYDAELPENEFPPTKMDRQMGFVVNGDDGKIYVAGVFAKELFAFDIKTGELESLGDYSPEGMLNPYAYQIEGLAFDSEGIAWYAIVFLDEMWQSRGARLIGWDFKNGKKPIDYGYLGDVDRIVHTVSELHIHNDIMYVADSNHLFDAPAMITVDIKKLKETDLSVNRQMTEDMAPYVCVKNGYMHYPGNNYDEQKAEFMRYMEETNEHFSFLEHNPISFKTKECHGIRLWKMLEPKYSPVKYVENVGGNKWVGYCGNDEKTFKFTAENYELSSVEEYSGKIPSHIKTEISENAVLPSFPGRQYLNKPNASVKYKNSAFVGTKDGFLAIVTDDKVYSVGKASTNGPVRALCYNERLDKVYGVAGHDEDLGNVFSYEEENGLHWLGRCYENAAEEPGLLMNSILASCDINEDGTILCIGAGDGLGCLYFYGI